VVSSVGTTGTCTARPDREWRAALSSRLLPLDFSPVCTDVLCRFRDAEYLTFTENVDVLGISLEPCYAHKEFIDRYDIPFPLSSDSTGRVTEQFGLADDEWERHLGVPKRALVTIDESHEVRYKWHTEDGYESPNYDEFHESVLSLSKECCSRQSTEFDG
jgi:peroxiredoxin